MTTRGDAEPACGRSSARAAEATDRQEDLRGPVWYKRRIAAVLVERALLCALRKAGHGTR